MPAFIAPFQGWVGLIDRTQGVALGYIEAAPLGLKTLYLNVSDAAHGNELNIIWKRWRSLAPLALSLRA